MKFSGIPNCDYGVSNTLSLLMELDRANKTAIMINAHDRDKRHLFLAHLTFRSSRWQLDRLIYKQSASFMFK